MWTFRFLNRKRHGLMVDRSVQEFQDDEHAYLAWVQSHPNGYVLNTRRTRNPEYMVLHRTSCTWIRERRQRATPGEFTEGNYIKVCAAVVESLANWARKNGRQQGDPFSKRCGFCRP